jgi:SAM-dependent methyltransferase
MAWFAPCYDGLLAMAEAGWLGDLRRELLADVAGVVVELGAGTGANLPWYPPRVALHLTEPDPDMRERLSRRATTRPGTTVHAASAEALPFGDATVDVVVCTLVLCSVADVDRAVDEAFRVLRPGGVLLFVEHVASPGWRGRVQRGLDPVWQACAGGCHLHRDPLPSIRRHAPPDVRTSWPRAMPPFLQPLQIGRVIRPQPPRPATLPGA